MGNFMWFSICPLRRNVDNFSGNQSQALMMAEFIAGVEHHLHAEADSQQRVSFLAEKLDGVRQFLELKFRHPVGKCPDTGKNQAVRIDNGFRLVGENDLGAAMLQSGEPGLQIISNFIKTQ